MPAHCLFELNQSISQQESITALTEDQACPPAFENRLVRVVWCPECVSASWTQLVSLMDFRMFIKQYLCLKHHSRAFIHYSSVTCSYGFQLLIADSSKNSSRWLYFCLTQSLCHHSCEVVATRCASSSFSRKINNVCAKHGWRSWRMLLACLMQTCSDVVFTS